MMVQCYRVKGVVTGVNGVPGKICLEISKTGEGGGPSSMIMAIDRGKAPAQGEVFELPMQDVKYTNLSSLNSVGCIWEYVGADAPKIVSAVEHAADIDDAEPPYYNLREPRLSEDPRFKDYYQYEAEYKSPKGQSSLCCIFSKEALPLFGTVFAQDLKSVGRGSDGTPMKLYNHEKFNSRAFKSTKMIVR